MFNTEMGSSWYSESKVLHDSLLKEVSPSS